jgi:hypothetical protein
MQVPRLESGMRGEKRAARVAAFSLGMTLQNDYRLVAIKLLHTTVWALMAACVLAIPVAGFVRQFRWAVVLTAIIIGECVVLAANRGRCPLTDWAARFTDDRADNFDIYLPNWLARHNKEIFGTLFVVSEAIVLWRWVGK